MSKPNQTPRSEQFAQQEDQDAQQPAAAPVKKKFVEPAVSVPVDVLEATTFFQVTVASGGAIS